MKNLRKTQTGTHRRRRRWSWTACNNNDKGLLLPVHMFGLAEGWNPKQRAAKVFSLLTQVKELTYEAVVEGVRSEGYNRHGGVSLFSEAERV